MLDLLLRWHLKDIDEKNQVYFYDISDSSDSSESSESTNITDQKIIEIKIEKINKK